MLKPCIYQAERTTVGVGPEQFFWLPQGQCSLLHNAKIVFFHRLTIGFLHELSPPFRWYYYLFLKRELPFYSPARLLKLSCRRNLGSRFQISMHFPVSHKVILVGNAIG